MNLMTEAYITGVGSYLPGDPVGNTELAARFGDGSLRGAARRNRALAANGIRTRHYAVNDKGMTVMLPASGIWIAVPGLASVLVMLTSVGGLDWHQRAASAGLSHPWSP
jgi:hypothetical protein